ncbi:ISAs1 family transposase [Bradyrhizobium arachidis]|uniref:ISAs1 family transposase n=1 Tax=Bradyrhizobium arachidis TaxID=858423 RepID=A0AAE7TGD5_9BRAD|nr:ISAs1 family transposase [Bradyrhizobium arachidis]
MACRATTRSAACSACSSRKSSRRHSVAPWRPRQGQWAQAHGGGGRRWQGTALRLRTRWQGHAAASGQRLRGGGAHGLGAAESARSQRDGRRLGSAGASQAAGLYVTADAQHCSRAFASAVPQRGGDYALVVKANRGPLFKAAAQQFARLGKRSSAAQAAQSSHDRREARRATVMRNTSLAAHHNFPSVVAVGRLTSRRRLRGKPADTPVVRYYLLSKYISPKRLLHISRSHWSIENQLHWVLDVHFAEDGNRARKDNAREHAILRRLALNILRSPRTAPRSGAKSSAPAGTMPSFSACSAI